MDLLQLPRRPQAAIGCDRAVSRLGDALAVDSLANSNIGPIVTGDGIRSSRFG